MEINREHKRGLIGTIVFHTIVLILLLFLGFFTPLPLPGEEGILVNFGTSNNGLGDFEPSPAPKKPAQTQPVQEEKKEAIPEPVTPPPTSPPPTPQPEPAKEVAMTQDYEQTAAIDAAEKKKREEEKIREKLREDERIKKQREDERIRQEQLERIRRIEEAERQRKQQEEAERKAREEEQRKINEINNRAQGAFGEGGSGTGGKGTSDGKSQGTTFPGGNQGSPTGDPNAGTYGQGGSGSGDQGSGVSYNLAGRKATSLAKPRYPGNDAGIVVVKVTVDKYGKVTSAEPGVRGTTIMNQQFWNEAKQAALKTKFNIDENAAAFQQGTITYKFTLD